NNDDEDRDEDRDEDEDERIAGRVTPRKRKMVSTENREERAEWISGMEQISSLVAEAKAQRAAGGLLIQKEMFEKIKDTEERCEIKLRAMEDKHEASIKEMEQKYEANLKAMEEKYESKISIVQEKVDSTAGALLRALMRMNDGSNKNK
ncbi:hypothetical protein BGZ73_003562, partial [Actinomortierella ambigua]